MLQFVSTVVSDGIVLITNCRKLSLYPAIQEQVAQHLQSYLNEETTELQHVICVIVILHTVGATDCLVNQTWTEGLFDMVEDLISRVRYHQDLKNHCVYYSQTETGYRAAAANIIICLHALALNPQHQCQTSSILQRQKHKVRMLLESECEGTKEHTTTLLNTLKDHKCSRCHGNNWMEKLLSEFK
jgi:hypothetical protein